MMTPSTEEPLTLSYESWERQMALASLWIALGLLAFWVWGRRRICLRTALAALVLTSVPLICAPGWMTFCNAVLAGWLAALVTTVLVRIAKRLERKFPSVLHIQNEGGAL